RRSIRVARPYQRTVKIASRLPSLSRTLCKARGHDPAEKRGRRRPNVGERRGLDPQDRADTIVVSRAFERPSAADRFVNDGAKREDVRTSVRRPPIQLFGRHVTQRAGKRAGLCQLGRPKWHDGVHRLDNWFVRFGKTEIEQLRDCGGRWPAGSNEKDVAWLEIAMGDAGTVRA